MVRQQSTGTTLIKVQGNDGSLHDRPSYEIWPSETGYQFSFRKQSWKDDESLLGFKFSRVQTSRKGFMNFFNGSVKHQEA